MKPSSSDNMIVAVFRCITVRTFSLLFIVEKRVFFNCIFLSQTAISTKSREAKSNPCEHWLDYAKEKCGSKMVNDTKILLKILVLYLPLPFFWALYDQQGSRWTFQATRMDGNIGIYDIKPDQLQVINPLLILTFIPLFEAVFYPLLAKVGISRPLQKLTCGGILAGIAFVISGLVEFQLEKTYPVLPRAGEAQLRFFNGLPCDYSVSSPHAEKFTLKAFQVFEQKHIAVGGDKTLIYKLEFISGPIDKCSAFRSIDVSLMINETLATSVFLGSAKTFSYPDDPDKSKTGEPRVRFLLSTKNTCEIKLKSGLLDYKTNSIDHELIDIHSGLYKLYFNDSSIADIDFKQGGVYTVIGYESDGKFQIHKFEIAAPNSMNMLWLVPQYILMTLGEVMFSVTGLAFSYSQAPDTMKSVLQACWLLTVAFGNAILMIVVEIKFFESQAYEFLLFAVLMFADMIIFIILARQYKSSGDPNAVQE